MIVSEFIEWLNTIPQDATVQVLSHSRGHNSHDQGGNCTVEEFTLSGQVGWKPSESFGNHYELTTHKGITELQLGVMDK